MKNTRNVKNRVNKDVKENQAQEQTVEVLYQRMGDRWYAFSLIDDEVFVGSIPVTDLELNHRLPLGRNL
ncbi:hypothetical protein EBS43_02290 [bacterium]|jgi:hypothetical protein|nr:hypothetical protein [bacterium]